LRSEALQRNTQQFPVPAKQQPRLQTLKLSHEDQHIYVSTFVIFEQTKDFRDKGTEYELEFILYRIRLCEL